MQSTFTRRAQGRIRFGAEHQGNKVVHAGGHTADHVTAAGAGIDFLEPLTGGLCVQLKTSLQQFSPQGALKATELARGCAQRGWKQPEWYLCW